MATFKVGDRVRLVYQDEGSARMWGSRVGCEGVITSIGRRPGFACEVRFDGEGPDWDIELFAHLAPLAPPDAWAADAVRKVTRPVHVEPVAPKVTV